MLSDVMEDYLKSIYSLQTEEGEPVSTSALADHLDVTPPTVTSMVEKLEDRGLVEREKYKGVELTSEGETVALEVLRHHRLLEAYLTEHLDYSWSQVHEEADALEHHISEEFERRVAEALDDPEVDPHGDPIPSADLTPPEADDTRPLSEHATGDQLVVARVSDRDEAELQYLAEAGIAPGTELEVVDVAPFGMVTVRVDDSPGDHSDPDDRSEVGAREQNVSDDSEHSLPDDREQSLPESVAASIRVLDADAERPTAESGVGGGGAPPPPDSGRRLAGVGAASRWPAGRFCSPKEINTGPDVVFFDVSKISIRRFRHRQSRTTSASVVGVIGAAEALDILVGSWREGFVQVSGFVGATVLLFSLVQYRFDGRLTELLQEHERAQPLVGGLLGLTPGCGGAIIAMPLYIRGTVSFGTVVAALAATAGDSAFVILALAPEAAIYAYGLAFVAAVLFGYAIDIWGLGIGRVDRAVDRMSRPVTDGGFAATSVAEGGPSVPQYEDSDGHDHGSDVSSHDRANDLPSYLPDSRLLERASHAIHVLWWVVLAGALVAGVMYLARGAEEPAWEVAATYDGLFTVAGLVGTTLSFYLYFVGRHYIGDGESARLQDSFASLYRTFQHAAEETSMVTVWVIAGYLLYEYGMAVFALDIQSLAASAGVLAPIAGAAIGLIPGCAAHIVFAQLYALEEAIPFSALTANAISQDGDALFPLMAIDLKAAIVATIYTTIPAVLVGVGLHYFWPYASFGFGVLG